MFIKLKCKIFECYDIDGEIQHTFENKISRLGKGNFCIPIICSKYNDGSFAKLAFTKTDIEISEEIQHLNNIQNWNTKISKEYFVNYESYYFNHKEIELYIFPTKKEYLKSKIESEYLCFLEDYKDYDSDFQKEKEILFDYGPFGDFTWNLYGADKITCDLTNNLLLFYNTNKDFEQIYLDVSTEDLKKEIEKIKNKLYNIGIEKEIVDNATSEYEIDLMKIKKELFFRKLKNECKINENKKKQTKQR